jgi:hypothetical protein
MTSWFSIIGKVLLIFGLVAFLSLGIFSVSSSTMSTMNSNANCPFGGHSIVICKMNPMEHIEEWQSMFTMLPAQDLLSLLFALFALLAISKLRFWSKFSTPEPPLLLSKNQYALTNSFRIFDPLKEAFSSGILNPKIF